MPDKLTVAIKTGANPPDVVQLDEVLFGTYLTGEVPFVELSDRIKESKIDQDIVPQRPRSLRTKERPTAFHSH